MSQQPIGTVGSYELLGILGRGGMGVVYRVRRTALKREFALKAIRVGEDVAPEAVARFAREAQSAARLADHPGIVGVHDIGEAEGVAYFVMDLVEGKSLDRIIEEGDVSPADAAGYVEQAARALHFAHANGVFHRDIKPANLMVTPEGQVRVTDFGLAVTHEADQATARLTQSGAVLGTPSYMAPEQATGRIVDARADVYGLGATLYDALAGRAPFVGGTMVDILQRLLAEDPPWFRTLNVTVPRELEVIVRKCLEKDPDRRYPTAEALAADLARFRAGEPIQARAPSRAERLWRRVRRNPAAWSAGAAAVVIALGALAVFAQQRLQAAAGASARYRARLESAESLIDPAPEQALGALRGLAAERPGDPAVTRLLARAQQSAAQASVRELERLASRLAGLADRQAAKVRACLAQLHALEHDVGPDAAQRAAGAAAALDDAWAPARAYYAGGLEVLADHGASPVRAGIAARFAALAWERLTWAERSGDRAGAARFLELVRAHGGPAYASRLAGAGTLTLRTDPSGAAVSAARYEDPDGDGRLTLGSTVALGSTPLERSALPMGSYLLTVHCPGYRDTRYPVLIERATDCVVRETIPLFTDAELGEDWIYVPAGESILGGDPDAQAAFRRHRRWVPGFVLSRVEVTAGQYAEWLEALLARGTPVEEVTRRLPRESAERGHFWEVREGHVAPRTGFRFGAHWPAIGISAEDAEGWLQWAGADGPPARLPTEAEWERAARGADGRCYPWGDGFDWAWTRGGNRSGQGMQARPNNVGRLATDESPFGIRDMAGNASEWCAAVAGEPLRRFRGGGWSVADADHFRAAGRPAGRPDTPSSWIGFRLARDLPKR